MTLRIFLSFFLIIIGGTVGFSMADKLKESQKICEEINYLFQRISFLISYRHDDVYTICRNLKSDDELKRLTFLDMLPDCYKSGENFREIWSNAVNSQKNIGSEEAELLIHLGSVLGKSSIDGQIEIISDMQCRLNQITKVRTDNLLKKGRLYRSTGILFGIMAGIIVI